MVAPLIQLDHKLFALINHFPHNIFFDAFFAFISGIGTAGFVWVLIIIALFIWEKMKDKQGFYALVLALISSYLTVEVVIKNIFRRPRPYLSIPDLIEIGAMSSSFSFISGHATVSFAAAYILSFHHRIGKWAYYILAFLIAFSRIYLGKHYPSDVVLGAALGSLIGYICIRATNIIQKKT